VRATAVFRRARSVSDVVVDIVNPSVYDAGRALAKLNGPTALLRLLPDIGSGDMRAARVHRSPKDHAPCV
jgi:hypothetical protein